MPRGFWVGPVESDEHSRAPWPPALRERARESEQRTRESETKRKKTRESERQREERKREARDNRLRLRLDLLSLMNTRESLGLPLSLLLLPHSITCPYIAQCMGASRSKGSYPVVSLSRDRRGWHWTRVFGSDLLGLMNTRESLGLPLSLLLLPHLPLPATPTLIN